MPEKDELNYTANDIPNIIENMTDSNINPPTNPVPGTEVTQTPGLIPETPSAIPGYDPNTANPPQEFVPATETGTTWDGTAPDPDGGVNTTEGYVQAQNTSGVGGAEADRQIDADDAAHEAHREMMKDPNYAVHIHEHQLNKIADMLEEIVTRVVSIEKKIMDHEEEYHLPDDNDPLKEYPEVRNP